MLNNQFNKECPTDGVTGNLTRKMFKKHVVTKDLETEVQSMNRDK